MKTNPFSKISIGLAVTTLLIVVGFVQLSFLPVSSEESHVAGALMAPGVFVIAAIMGVVLGAIGIVLAGAALMRKERRALALLALTANLPIPILSAVILLRNLNSDG
jgi:hypothetical protein